MGHDSTSFTGELVGRKSNSKYANNHLPKKSQTKPNESLCPIPPMNSRQHLSTTVHKWTCVTDIKVQIQ